MIHEFLREASVEPDILLPDDLHAASATGPSPSASLQQWKDGGRPMATGSALVRGRMPHLRA